MLGARTSNRQVGWRLPDDLIADVSELAATRRIPKGRMVTLLLREQIEVMRTPLTATELEARVRYPEHFSRR
jgi:hypothetical protein